MLTCECACGGGPRAGSMLRIMNIAPPRLPGVPNTQLPPGMSPAPTVNYTWLSLENWITPVVPSHRR